MVPPLVVLLPLFIMFSWFNIRGTYLSMIIAQCGFLLPFSIWMLSGFIAQIPVNLEESAMVDGCSRIKAFFRVTLPLIAPGLAATWILVLIFAWNDFLLALILTTEETKTLPLFITGFRTDRGIEWGPASAAGTVTVIPILILALTVQRNLVRGLTMGAVKG